MPNRRRQIEMSTEEVAAFLESERTVTCASNGVRGWPHLMPLWYVVRDGELWAWTFARSQKVRNLQRDPRATLQVEAGASYDQLRGVMIEADTEIHSDLEVVQPLGVELMTRYTPAEVTLDDDAREGVAAGVAAQAPKRVALRFVARRVASWDHRKLP